MYVHVHIHAERPPKLAGAERPHKLAGAERPPKLAGAERPHKLAGAENLALERFSSPVVESLAAFLSPRDFTVQHTA